MSSSTPYSELSSTAIIENKKHILIKATALALELGSIIPDFSAPGYRPALLIGGLAGGSGSPYRNLWHYDLMTDTEARRSS